jgi:hypothetical protein
MLLVSCALNIDPRYSFCLPLQHLNLCQVHCLLRTAAETKHRIKNVLAIYFPLLLNFCFFPPFNSFAFPTARLYPISELGLNFKSVASSWYAAFFLALQRNCVYKRILVILTQSKAHTIITVRILLYIFVLAVVLLRNSRRVLLDEKKRLVFIVWVTSSSAYKSPVTYWSMADISLNVTCMVDMTLEHWHILTSN